MKKKIVINNRVENISIETTSIGQGFSKFL